MDRRRLPQLAGAFLTAGPVPGALFAQTTNFCRMLLAALCQTAFRLLKTQISCKDLPSLYSGTLTKWLQSAF